MNVTALAKCCVAISAIALMCATTARAGDPLPSREGILDTTLDNGLRVIVVPHDNPPGRTVLRLIVDAGSLDELDNERGVAHVIQHMAFHGSDQFPAGSARRVFQSLGMELDRHENAYTTFDHTVYTLNLPGVSESVLDKGLTFLSDVLDGLTFPDPAMETERSVILDEMRQYDSPERRVFQRILPALAPGSLVSERFPTGDTESIDAMMREQCVAFYSRLYTPDNSTLLVVGDVEIDAVRTLIVEHFAPIKPRKSAQRPESGVRPFTEQHALVVTDPELVRGVVAAIAVGPPTEPARHGSQFRDQLVDQLVRQLITRRLEARSFNGEASYAGNGMYVGNAYGAMWIGQIVLIGPSSRSPGMLADLISEIERARQYGFTDAEVQLARETLLAEARSIAEGEANLPATSIAGLLTEPIVADAPLISSGQNFALLEKLLPTITAANVTDRFIEMFAPERTAILVELGDGVPVPTETAVMKDVRRIAAQPVAPPQSPVALQALLETPPGRASLDSADLDAASGVLTMHFENGVVAHHRLMNERASEVTLRLTLAGGEIEEDATTRGLTRAASVVFDRPATQTLTGLTVRDFLSSRGISIRSRVSLDAVTIEIDTPRDQINAAFQLLYLTLIDPIIEPAGLDDWRQRETARALRRSTQTGGLVEDALVATMYPADEVRVRSLTPELIERIDVDAAQTWLRNLVLRAPIELSIVGDISRSAAAELASRYVGSLPARATIDHTAFAERRKVQRAKAPFKRTITTTTQSDQAVVAVGFVGPDSDDIEEARVLDVAERVLRPHLIQKLRDELGLVSSVTMTNRPAQALPGFGLFLVIAPTSPAQSSLVADLIDREFEQLALGGPGLLDVVIAQSQLASAASESLLEPEHWSKQLADMRYRNRSLPGVTQSATAHQDVEPSHVRDALAHRLSVGNRIRIIILPEDE